MNYIEDNDGDDVIMIPVSQVKCCGEWVGNIKVYPQLIKVEKPGLTYWQCPTCKGCY